MGKIAIVIINHKTPKLVTECLVSLVRERDAENRFKIYVGDADSGDDSLSIINCFIKEKNFDFVTCFPIGGNYGFAYGNNFVLINYVLCDKEIEYVYFLNPDTYIRAGAVDALEDALRIYPKIGVVGSRLENPDGTVRASGFRFPTPWREFFCGVRLSFLGRMFPFTEVMVSELENAQKVDWVTGASFMMPRTALQEIGLMDIQYFLYFEEVDLMARMKKAGYEIWHIPESRVVHLQGQATGVRAQDAVKRIPDYWYQSRFKFFNDYHGRVGAIFANVLYLIGDVFYRIHRGLRFKPIMDPPYLWHDMLTHGFALPKAKGTSQ
ncbi:glycosyltransferase [Comamonas flocculans]|uniref:Glycosyltransferase family 2 protein n=1 Tax=Comamonas flocculans TaxID=2597701 RepID=A0A5B8RUJ3_9BURK|nr:glycosyltransferase family 2 protein [Comamonas flocculans]QEA12488.1 glycosyltransferase family 2 protein [Comamonas flocculans]